MTSRAFFALLVLLAPSAVARAQSPQDNLILKTTSRMPEELVASIKSYSGEKKWLYLGDNKIKQGEVTLVKFCIPEVAQHLWAAGLQVSAVLPCGNVGIYKKGADTEISMLHPRYMNVLYPHPATERASAIALPLIHEMLDAVTK